MRHTNRRRAPRVVLQSSLIPNCHIQDPAGKAPGVVGRILNLGRGGVAIHIAEVPLGGLSLEQELLVTTTLPRSGMRLKRVACVVSQRRDEVCGKIFGLRWVDSDAADSYAQMQTERLEKALQKLMRRSRRDRSKEAGDFVALVAEKTGQRLLHWPKVPGSEAANLAGCMPDDPSQTPAMTLDERGDGDSSPASADALQPPCDSDSILVRVRGWWSAVSPAWWKERPVAEGEDAPTAAQPESQPAEPDSDPAPSARQPRIDARELLFGSVEDAPPYAPRQLDSADEAIMRRPLEEPRAVANRPSTKFDVDRIYKSWLESARTALTSTNPEMSRSRFDFAIECYHKLRHSGATAELLRSVEVATRYLIALYPTESRCCVVQGFLDEAASSHSATRRTTLLQQAESLLFSGMNNSKCNAGRLQGMLEKLRNGAVAVVA